MTLSLCRLARPAGLGAMAACCVLLALGCASSQKPAPKEVSKTVAYREYTLKDLRDELAAQQKQLKTLSGNVNAELSSRIAPGGKQAVSGLFAFEKPDKIRMSIAKPMTKMSVDLISDGNRFWLVNHSQKTVQTGRCESLVGVDSDKVPFRPMDLVDAYFLREITDDPGFSKRITFMETIGNYYIISVLRDDFSNFLYSKIWVNRFTGLVDRHQLYDGEKGAIRVDALLDKYEAINNIQVPHRLAISWPSQLSTIDIQLRAVRLNQKFENPKVFVFDSTKPDYAFVDLDESGKMEQSFGGLRERQSMTPPGYPSATPKSPGGFGFQPTAPAARPAAPPRPPEPAPNYVPPPNPYKK